MDDVAQPDPGISPAALETALGVLRAAAALDPADPTYLSLERAAAGLTKTAKKKRRLNRRREARARDRLVVEQASTFQRHEAVEAPPTSLGELHRRRHCYVCKSPYRTVHGFYHHLCPTCAARHFEQRSARVDLSGRRALLTGGRIKIGFQIALKLLRDGAAVTITTRFPKDAARRFGAEPDFPAWGDRLSIVAIDLRSLPDVLDLIDRLRVSPPLDLLIHNAAQTVRRPPAYYAELAAAERTPLAPALTSLVEGPLAGGARLDRRRGSPAWLLPQFLTQCESADSPLFPPGRQDVEGQPLDLRRQNSWTLKLNEIDPLELVEVQVVNAIVPFLFNSRLRESLERSRFKERCIVNVSAVEGQFTRGWKTPFHPHTNMAKAALNMQTRTSAEEYAASGIYMCSVDTGWITDENPEPTRTRLSQDGFRPPLDVVDGAARVYHPIVSALSGTPLYGCFLKDYAITGW